MVRSWAVAQHESLVNVTDQLSTVADWSFLQTLFIFALIVIFAAALFAFCYTGGGRGCYVTLTGKKRYNKWSDVPLDDLSWDDVEDPDEEEVVSGAQFFRPVLETGRSRSYIEMK